MSLSPRWQEALVLIGALLAALATARLGWWQLDRAAQKTALHATQLQQAALPVLDRAELARTPDEAAAQRHRRIRLEGRWFEAGTVALDNRQMNGRPGFYVVTPLVLAAGDAVLVQRGWMPRDPADRTRLAPVVTPSGTVQIVGQIAPGLARLFEFDGAASGPIRQNLDIAEHSRETGLALRPLAVVQLDDPSMPGDGLLRQWPQAGADVSKNHGYAMQWFALSALITGLYVWFRLLRPRRQPR
jgi:surfeit locus 1 family protein